MLEMLTFSLFELQGILRKEKKKGQSTLVLAIVGGGISLKPKSGGHKAGSMYLCYAAVESQGQGRVEDKTLETAWNPGSIRTTETAPHTSPTLQKLQTTLQKLD